MRLRPFAIAFLLTLTAAGSLSAATEGSSDPLLTPDGTLFLMQRSADGRSLQLVQRTDDVRAVEVVPATSYTLRVSDPRIAYEPNSKTLVALWRRAGFGNHGDEIVVTTLDNNGSWSTPHVVAPGSVSHADLQIAVSRTTRPNYGDYPVPVLLIHAVWRAKPETGERPEYALLAYEGAQLVSSYQADLANLAGFFDAEDNGDTTSRPLTISTGDDTVDIVFGLPGSTTLSRLRFKPQLDARVFIPTGKQHSRMSYLEVESTGHINALTVGKHVVLYTVDANMFRYSINTDGMWEPVHSLRVDDKVTADDIIRELLRATADK
ncbi:MAG TPA: hypothetical protein VN181_10280 [Thermoanaerobaculia bacterium]|nr:hypothetical protein [Thermoanaerobaculia bacterium]